MDKVRRGVPADTPERHAAALSRAAILEPIAAQESEQARAEGAVDWLTSGALERVIGEPNFEPPAFLELGLAVSRAVCLVTVRDRLGGTLASGTGFLVAPGIVLTNHHVITSFSEAADTQITFDYRTSSSGADLPVTTFSLDPARLFLTDPDRDCSFVAVGPRVAGRQSIGDYPWLPLVGRVGKLEVGDPVYIIQHPEGERMKFVLRDNRLLLLPRIQKLKDPEVFAHYEADTLRGTSGAPVCSRYWEVIALHHQAVPDLDANGNVLDVDGKPYAGSDDSRVRWIGNEGIRVTALTRFLEETKSSVAGAAADLVELVLRSERPDYVELARRAQHANSEAAFPSTRSTSMSSRDQIELTVPLHITLRLGAPQYEASVVPEQIAAISAPQSTTATGAGARSSKPSGSAADPMPSPELQQRKIEAFAELNEARRRTYYSRTQDEADRSQYYGDVQLGADPVENFRTLSELLEKTHSSQPKYSPSTHLYPWIDLHKKGRELVIRSIYSGQVFDAETFLDEAFRNEARRESLRRTMRLNEAFAVVPEQALEDLLEANAPYNCEHVVPQSWFQKKEPMRGDLHHLFACESGCNSFRGNHAYHQFAADEAYREKCGRREQNRFEPTAGKGAVARATMYFLLRYPGGIDLPLSLMDQDRLAQLIAWHESDKVNDYELHRNQAIFAAQGNRNPLIDHPEWVSQIDWQFGLDGL